MKGVNYAMYFVARAMPGAVNLINAVLISSLFGVQFYGEYSTQLSFILGISALCYGWVSQSVSRYAYGENFVNTARREFLYSYCLASLTVLLSLFIIIHFKIFNNLFVLFSIFGYGAHLIFLSLYQARMNQSDYASAELIRSFALLVFPVFGGMVMNDGKVGVLIGLYMSFIIWPSVALLKSYVRNERSQWLSKLLTKRHDFHVSDILQYGWAISFWLGFSLLTPFIERVLIGQLYDKQVLGDYSYTFDLVFKSFTFVLLPLNMLAQPKIFKSYSNNEFCDVKKLIIKSSTQQVCLGAGFSVLYYALLCLINEYHDLNGYVVSAYYFFVLSAAAIFWQISLLMHKLLECLKKTYLMLIIEIFVILICVVFGNFLLSFSLGILSFPLMSLLSALIYCGAVWYVGNKLFIINYERNT